MAKAATKVIPRSLVIDRVDWKNKQFYGKSSTGDRRRQRHDYAHTDLFPERGQVIEFTGPEPTEIPKGNRWDLEYAGQKYSYLEEIPDECLFDVMRHSSDFYHIGKSRIEALANQFGDSPRSLFGLLRAAHEGDIPEALKPLAEQGNVLKRLIAGWRISEWHQRCQKLGISVRTRRRFFDIYRWNSADRFEENPFRIMAYADDMDSRKLWRILAKAHPERLEQAAWAAVWALFYQQAESYQMSIPEETLDKELKSLLGARWDPELIAAIEGAGQLIRRRGHYQLRPISVLEGWIADHLKRLNNPENAQLPETLSDVDWEDAFKDIDREDIESSVVMAQCRALEAGRLMLIYGEAGTGKTSLSVRFLSACLKAGWCVQVVAISNIAVSRVRGALDSHLAEDGGVQERVRYSSVQSFLYAQVVRDAPPTIIMLDEASMIGSGALLELLGRIRDCDRLLMVGDPKQVPPIGWGAVFHMLRHIEGLNRIVLTDRMRQKEAGGGILDFLDTLEVQATPRVRDAIRGNDEHVTHIDCPNKPLERLESHLIKEIFKTSNASLPVILTVSRRDAKAVNDVCQKLHAKRLPREHKYVKSKPGGFMVGEPILSTLNQPLLGLWNGSRGVVILHEGQLKAQFLGQEKLQAIQPDFERAYAITVHRAQGEGHDEVILYLGEHLSAKLNHRGTLYTAITRASQKLTIVADTEQFDEGYKRPNPALKASSVSFSDI